MSSLSQSNSQLSLFDSFEDDEVESKINLQELVTKVEIVGNKKVQKNKQDKLHVQYVLHVTTTIPGLTWVVQRRYNLFAQTHKELLKLFKEKDLPSLPPKHTLNLSHSKFSHEAIEQRSHELNKYLSELLKHKDVARSDPFCSLVVGTFHDLFTRLKTFAHKCEKLEKELQQSEQQRQNAIAQLNATRRRNEELTERVAQLQKENETAQAQLTDSSSSTFKHDHAINTLKEHNKHLQENHLAELKECNFRWEQKTATLEAAIYDLQNNVSHLEQQTKKLKSEKKILVQAIKDLRDGKDTLSTKEASTTTTTTSNTSNTSSTSNMSNTLNTSGDNGNNLNSLVSSALPNLQISKTASVETPST